MLSLKAVETFEEEMLQTTTAPPAHRQPASGITQSSTSTPLAHLPDPGNVQPATSTPLAHPPGPGNVPPAMSMPATHHLPDPTTVPEPVTPSIVLDDLNDDIPGCTHMLAFRMNLK